MAEKGYLLTDSHKDRTVTKIPYPKRHGSDGAELSPGINPHVSASAGTHTVLFGINPYDLRYTRGRRSAERDGGTCLPVEAGHLRIYRFGENYG